MINDFFLLAIFLIVMGGIWLSVYFIRKEIREFKKKKEEDLAFNLLAQRVESLSRSLGDGFSQITKELGRVHEIGHTLRDFQNLLRSPKLRGGIGEEVLKDLLSEVLPKSSFQIPYQFRGGQIVDAIVKTKQGLIPIDSKFPLENFQKYLEAQGKEKENYLKEFVRDVKKHIDDISQKYILPQEGTLDYAIMYIPAESLFSEIANNQPELLEYARSKKILLVSPNSFYYFLKIILMGLEGAKIEEASKKILEGLKAIRQESEKLGKELATLIIHIDHAKGTSNRVQARFERLAGRINGLRLLEFPEEKKKLKESNR